MLRRFHYALLLASIAAAAQNEGQAPAGIQPIVPSGYRYVGKVKPRTTLQIRSSNWILGCETLDRDMADYDQYKQYLAPLGAKRIRLQAGWAKTEKSVGVYDWQWLDHIIDDAIARGIAPWLQASYGNPLYPRGGGINLSAGIPSSEEALQAWDRWIEAMARRYRGRVKEWEVWNEPNFGDNTINSPEAVADLNIRTAAIIKRIQPEAKISGMSMGHIDLPWADTFFRRIHQRKKMGLFDNMTYHDYVYNPDANYPTVRELRRVLDKYAPQVKLRQGENGAPSMGGGGRGALGDFEWSERTQAKWIIRRMLSDLGHDIECSILGIIDMNYPPDGPITRLNVKGLIQSDSTRKAIKTKLAYHAMQNVTALFDDSLRRIRQVTHTYNSNATPLPGEVKFNPGTDRGLSVFGYENTASAKQAFTVWMNENVPGESNQTKQLRFTLIGANIDQPWYVDLLTGAVYEIPAESVTKAGNRLTISNLPAYDAPVLLLDRSLISLQ